MGHASPLILLFAVCAATAVAAWGATAGLRRLLLRWGVFDAPNPRSSHAVAKPRGGGLAVVAVAAGAWLTLDAALGKPGGAAAILALGLALAAVSFLDDLRGLPPLPRFAGQIAAVAAALFLFDAGPVFQGWLPLWLDRVLAGLAWLWFVNLFNFMDGIDGISGVETISIGAGLALVGAVAGWPPAQIGPPLVLAAAAAGFLVLNWAPSRVFLGDAGSIALGFLMGWLLLHAAAGGLWAAALILPGYYLADATLTLMRRLLRGERVWRPHRQHAYQKAVDAGWPHARVCRQIAAGNAGLVACGLLAVTVSAPLGLIAGAAIVALVLWTLAGGA